jgi:phosphotransferase system enzyme I (PtsI)
MLAGLPISPGVGLGRAFTVRKVDLDFSQKTFAGVEEEKARLAEAVEAFVRQSESLAQELRARAGAKEAEIVLGHVALLEDPFLTEEIEQAVETGQTAEAAVDAACGEVARVFAEMDDEMMRARAADMQAVRDRMLGLLLGRAPADLSQIEPGGVLVVAELTAEMAARFKRENVEAIVAETGGQTSHSAILARAMGIPTVMSAAGATERISSGTFVAVDGTAGQVWIDPGEAALAGLRRQKEAWLSSKAALQAFKARPTVDGDGRPHAICANISGLREAELAVENGADGIGLFRTEMLFLDRDAPPSEDEQFEVYRRIAELLGDRELIVRTLDVGGDKEIRYLNLPKEPNPFLGYRAIRFCLDEPELFGRQLRAILRAGAGLGNVKLMLPFIVSLEELEAALALIEKAKASLTAEGRPFQADMPVGVMIETPAAVLMADALARRAAFFSIGTNDLTQYALAADRLNPKVAGVYSHFHPAVLQFVERTVSAAKKAGIPVGMCGEAAGCPGLIPAYLAFGLDEWSVNPASVLRVRRDLAQWTLAEARQAAEKALTLTRTADVQAFLEETAKNKA